MCFIPRTKGRGMIIKKRTEQQVMFVVKEVVIHLFGGYCYKNKDSHVVFGTEQKNSTSLFLPQTNGLRAL
jgi:hypothetical protein